jgi:hypothetical protein
MTHKSPGLFETIWETMKGDETRWRALSCTFIALVIAMIPVSMFFYGIFAESKSTFWGIAFSWSLGVNITWAYVAFSWVSYLWCVIYTESRQRILGRLEK